MRVLNHGLIPIHYLQDNPTRSLRAYVQDYLKEEVFAEGLTRNLPAFSRFFDAMGYAHGELTNFANIARECSIDSKTVKEYYQILLDTLVGIRVEPLRRRQHRRVIGKAAKHYLFDVGVAGILTKRRLVEEKGEQFGRAFEHFILMELVAYRSYHEVAFDIDFWRTKSGLEVDFVLAGGEVAIEVKGVKRIDGRDERSLRAFVDEYSPAKALIVCNVKAPEVHGPIRVIPWREFLYELWAGNIIR